MKKKLFYLAAICMVVAFAACTSDGDDVTQQNKSAASKDAPALSNNLKESFTLVFDGDRVPFKEVAITETNKAIITLNKAIPAESYQRRAEGDDDEYIVGTYTFDGKNNTYTIIKDGDDSAYCTIELKNKESGKKMSAKIHLMSGEEIDDMDDQEFEADVKEKVASDEVSAKLCREWVVVNTRLRHKDGVTAVRHFENPDSAASLNAILDYAKTVATITEDLDEGTTITSIQFTSEGKFILYFQNGNNYIGKWSWSDLSKGYINYEWDSADMGNKFMKDGEAIFDVREFKKVKYYVITMAARIEEKNKTYKVELSFYVKEKAQ